jgi:methyl-accepting chemotaxis protein
MKGLKDISITNKLRLLCALFVSAMAVFGILSYRTFNQVKIGGAAYDEIALSNNLLSDHAQPTQSLLQERLLVYRMRVDIKDKATLSEEVGTFKGLIDKFEAGHTQWRNKVSDPKQSELLQKVYDPAHSYLELALSNYIPSLLEGKDAEADKVRIGELNPLYDLHEQATNEFVNYTQTRTEQQEKDAASMIASMIVSLFAAGFIAVAIVCGTTFLVARGIVRPLKQTVEALHQVSRGNLTCHLELDGGDEIAQMNGALNETVDHLARIMAQIGADADVLFRISRDAAGVGQQMAAAAEQTTTQAAAVSAAADQVSQNIQTVSIATDEMTMSIKDIAKNASEAAEVASSAARLAGATNTTMAKLSESSAEIGNVIKVITSIAEQTNLLALNATIEAARAGEAGKGFAVVANEVKELAKETAKATEDIGARVEAIQHDAKGAVQAIDEVTTVIGRINDIQNTIASAVEEQTGTTNEISRNVADTARGSSDIASNISGVTSSAKATQACAATSQQAASQLSELARSLTGVVSQFTLSSNGHGGKRVREADAGYKAGTHEMTTA